MFDSEYLHNLDLAELPPGRLVLIWLSNGIYRTYAPELRVFAEHGAGRAVTREGRTFTGHLRLEQETWIETIQGRERARVIAIASEAVSQPLPDGGEAWQVATPAMLLEARWRIGLADGTHLMTTPHGPALFTVERHDPETPASAEAWGIGYAHPHSPAALDIGLDITVARLEPGVAEWMITAPVRRLERLSDDHTSGPCKEACTDRA